MSALSALWYSLNDVAEYLPCVNDKQTYLYWSVEDLKRTAYARAAEIEGGTELCDEFIKYYSTFDEWGFPTMSKPPVPDDTGEPP